MNPADPRPLSNHLFLGNSVQPHQRLPELATNGFPFGSPFMLEDITSQPQGQSGQEKQSIFGFRFCKELGDPVNIPDFPLQLGYYDPETQTFNLPLHMTSKTDTIRFYNTTSQCRADGTYKKDTQVDCNTD